MGGVLKTVALGIEKVSGFFEAPLKDSILSVSFRNFKNSKTMINAEIQGFIYIYIDMNCANGIRYLK